MCYSSEQKNKNIRKTENNAIHQMLIVLLNGRKKGKKKEKETKNKYKGQRIKEIKNAFVNTKVVKGAKFLFLMCIIPL